MKYLILLLSILFFSDMALAQDLSKHQWQHRLILVISNELDQPLVQQQLSTLYSNEEGLAERKLKIYQVLPKQFRLDQQEWQDSDQLYLQFHQNNEPFMVILIGLDGGIKLKRTELLNTNELFALIDGMPMRRAEMRRKDQN